MADCRNCGAPATGNDPLGPICCAHCAFNPLGCRCRFGETGVPETIIDYSGMDSDEDDPDALYADADDEGDEWVLACGYPGCCMPGYHFRSECHNADDMEAYYAECEAERATEPQEPPHE